MLDAARAEGVLLVYARSTNPPPHGPIRNLLSRGAKGVVAFLVGDGRIVHFQSYRLVNGEIARSLAAYCGQGVYLDVALAWVVDRLATCPLELRRDSKRASGYNLPRLFGHFWKLVLTAGTRPLRMIAVLGGFSMLVALGLAVKAFYEKLINQVPVAGWTSLIVVLSFFSGVTLFSLAIIAEYLGLSLNMAMGKPTYLSVSRPASKPGSAP
jgi:undecaprenyl-phosphate 4-deoxy-4-formamido-L-arabinose transferase